MTQCTFQMDWMGRCKNMLPCADHDDLMCKGTSCTEKATHTCPETMQFVCGVPLCSDCHHVYEGPYRVYHNRSVFSRL